MILKLSLSQALWYECTCISADADFNTPTGEDAQLSISEYSYLVDGETEVAAMFTMVNSLALSSHNDIS